MNVASFGRGAGGETGRGSSADVLLSDGSSLAVDRMVLATGYRADLARVPYLAQVLGLVEVEDGYPVLDDTFQSNLPGLYLPGLVATRDFGPFFGFTKGCPTAAALIGRSLVARA